MIKNTDICEDIKSLIHLIITLNYCELKSFLETCNNISVIINSCCGWMKASPLHFAASISYKHDANKIIIDIIKLLIQYKAKVDCIDKFGRTPLYFAAKAGSAEIVKLFLDAGVSPNTEVVRKHKDAPASLPCIHNGSCPNEEIVFEDLDFPKHLGRTPLHEAVSGGHLFCVQLLLDKGAEVNAKDEENLIPLILAIKGTKDCDALTAERYERIVTKLLINDADANYFFDENLQRKHNNSAFFPTKMLDSAICNTPLQYAVNYGSVICVLELLFADAQITTKNKYDESVLHVAAKFGFTDILCLLLEFPDCDEELINSPDNRLRTPSHVAARNGIVDCLMMLLNNGGNLLAVDSVNLTVLDTIFIFFRQPTDFLLNFFNSKIKFIFTPREMCKRKISIDLSSLLQKNMKQQTALISHLSEHSRLLQHPLVETFVVCKWKKIRPIILFLHVVNTFFIITLSVFIFLQVYQCNLPYKIKKPLSYFLILFAILILLKCIIELKSLGRLRYKKIEPWLKTVFPLYSIALVVFTWIVNETCDNAARFNSVNHLSSIVILFAWIHIMFTLTRFYEYGFYGDMFLIVLSNVGKVLSSLFCLIIGFVLFFSINFRNDKLFGNPFFSFIKTIVMMTGEFDYNDLFTDEHDKIELYTTRIIFVLFMLMMTIVLMNIMSGLAITDIQDILVKAHVRFLRNQVELTSDVLRWLSCILPKWAKKIQKMPSKIIIRLNYFAKIDVNDIPVAMLRRLISTGIRNSQEMEIDNKSTLKLLREKIKRYPSTYKSYKHEINSLPNGDNDKKILIENKIHTELLHDIKNTLQFITDNKHQKNDINLISSEDAEYNSNAYSILRAIGLPTEKPQEWV